MSSYRVFSTVQTHFVIIHQSSNQRYKKSATHKWNISVQASTFAYGFLLDVPWSHFNFASFMCIFATIKNEKLQDAKDPVRTQCPYLYEAVGS